MTTGTLEPDTSFDFTVPTLLANPHAALAELRQSGPVVKAKVPGGMDAYLVTSYAAVAEATKRTEDFSSQMGHLTNRPNMDNQEALAILAEVGQSGSGLLLVSDDPDHKRYRALVNAVFAQGRIANLQPLIERIVTQLLDDMAQNSEADFVNEFAVLLPTYVIADILGLDRDHWHLVRKWSDAAILLVSRMGTAEQEVEAAKNVVDFMRFIRERLAARRQQPADDLISNLVNIGMDGVAPLTDDEAAALTLEIAVAGNETTRNTLMSGLMQLLRHPDQIEILRNDPSLVANAVEELLRYETPATSMWRIATRDTELAGTAIPQGAAVLLRFDAANRDPARFYKPDRFDITRKDARNHVAFGAPGIHRCLGQMLARKELAIALPALFARLKDIHILDSSDTDYWPGLLHRGITSLRIGYKVNSEA
ncbi:cytochrome P450 [Sphingobium lactosutens]|uniref:cytochrome P450 n=1 Tax=Sphingobium lactosutens TaxID=522773 RepID=UPI0015BD3601|nr:cytochrome P450 [Sphingobium lactosutens]NWK97909.1 cytochrome P450 [Sphingobium lactosutens]